MSVGILTALAAVTAAPLPASSATSLVGASGVDKGLSPTPSAKTLPGRGKFGDVKVTVSQTEALTNQAVSVSWTGAPPGTNVSNNFMQIFQCWGDDDGTNAGNPGPAPERCQFGGEPFGSNITSKIPAGTIPSSVYSRALSQSAWGAPYFNPAAGFYDSVLGIVWKPFKAVDGRTVNAQLASVKPSCSGCLSFGWQNPLFDFTSTNEKPWGRTYADGTGSELFQVDTGLEAPGLGCGQATEPKADGSFKIPKCWLVVVPRGTAAEENPKPLAPPGTNWVATSPLTAEAWANRIAFPLSFSPVDSPCALGGTANQVIGNDLAVGAVSSWEPKLCSVPGASPYSYSAVSDEQARRQLIGGTSNAGLAVVSRPFDTDVIDPANPVVYAPLTLSGLVVGFNIERVPTDATGIVRDPGEVAIGATRVSTLKLTPRLLAKLLTQSYTVPFLGPKPAGYEWLSKQPTDITVDPDFLQFNPEFTVMTVGSRRNTAALTVTASSSDAALAVWNWILADPEAKAWLDGTPDAWGMKVNPLYATTGSKNRSGQPFADPVPNSFPKNDPFCYQDPGADGIVPRPLCLLDQQPYALTMVAAAQATRAANDGALTSHDYLSNSQRSSNTWWAAEGPQALGARSILSITDTASAARYGLQTASLSRAGDDGTDRAFIAADTASLTEGVKAMLAQGSTSVLVPDPAAKVPGAYPLTQLTYASVFPTRLSESQRTAYADFLAYATGPGQTPGLEFGQLPLGYAPLPEKLVSQATTAAAQVRAGTGPDSSTTLPEQSTTSTTASVTATTASTTGGGGGGSTTGTTTDPGTSPTSTGTDQATSTTASTVVDSTSSPTATPGGSPGKTPMLLTSGAARYTLLAALVVAVVSGGISTLAMDNRWLAQLRTGRLPGPRRRRP